MIEMLELLRLCSLYVKSFILANCIPSPPTLILTLSKVSPELKTFVKNTLNKDPKKRWTAEQGESKCR